MLAYFIFNGIIFAQGYSKASANIKVKLIKGPMFSIVKGNLNFNEYSRFVKGELKVEPPDGILLQFTGINCSNIIIGYGDSEIHKIKAKAEKISYLKSSGESFIFLPVIERTNNLAYENAVEIFNGSSFALNSEENSAEVNLWIGGSLQLPNSLLNCFYSGIFALSLVYY